MATIKIEIPDGKDRTFRVGSNGSADQVLDEIRVLLDQSSSRSGWVGDTAKAAKARLARAHSYLKSLEKSEASQEATRVAKEMRRNWIRKNS